MSDKVQQAFERGVKALFPNPEPKKTAESCNVIQIWNKLASKFPKLYQFAEFNRRIRAQEERLMLFHKLDPRSEDDRGKLGIMFYEHLEADTSNTLEGALEGWWKKVSHE
jgi:hypothetical protein